MNYARQTQIYSVLDILKPFDIYVDISKSNLLDKIVEKLASVLYVENVHDIAESLPTDILVLPYSTQSFVDYTKVEKDQLCNKYHCLNEILFLVTYLEAHKITLLSTIRGVLISSRFRPLLYLHNMEADENNQNILDLQIPMDLDLRIRSVVGDIVQLQHFEHEKKSKRVKDSFPQELPEAPVPDSNFWMNVCIGSVVLLCVSYALWRKL